MGLFSAAVVDQINQIAAKSNEQLKKVESVSTKSMNDDLNKMSKQVIDYFKDSEAILITSQQALHEYVDKCIETGYAGIDTETTGVDRIQDWVVGASLYTPGQPECYFPMKHLVPIFDTLYKDQLTYEQVAEEFQRLVDNKVKLIFANADFDIAMVYHSLGVDLIPAFYYDVILAWRCIKENELDNALKTLYAKYVKKGKVDPKKFSDFFSPKLFPYCKPKVAALYAANDAKITYELFLWQLPYVTKTHEKCKKHHLEKIADLVWNIEFPMVSACALLHRRGIYLDNSIASVLHDRYTNNLHEDEAKLHALVQELIDTKDIATNRNRPFRTGADFNPNSQPHVKYLVNTLLGSSAKSTDKQVLRDLNQPATNAVLDVRGDVKLIGTYVDKLPNVIDKDHRVHASFNSIGANTGRMCIAKGTLVTTLDGDVPIEDVASGHVVLCCDDNGHIVQSEVLNTWLTFRDKPCVQLNFGGSGQLICTPDHRIKVLDNSKFIWKSAQDLEKGDQLIQLDLSSSLFESKVVTVDSVELAGLFDTYDIEVETYHNFIAGGICVHNSSKDPNMQNVPSHALDIRHMFRATPEMIEMLQVSEKEDGTIAVSLSKYDSVRSKDENLIKVYDLKKDDEVILKDGSSNVYAVVIDITENESDHGFMNIVLQIKEEKEVVVHENTSA